MIYAGFDLDTTRSELPRLFIGDTSLVRQSLHTQIGTNDFQAVSPVAIAIGGGYDDDAFQKLHKAIVEAFETAGKPMFKYAYFRADNEITDRLYAEGRGPQKRTPEYPAAIVGRLKAKLKEVLPVRDEDVQKTFLY